MRMTLLRSTGGPVARCSVHRIHSHRLSGPIVSTPVPVQTVAGLAGQGRMETVMLQPSRHRCVAQVHRPVQVHERRQ